VDLSGIIFVVLAVAWAVYLIPKALKHHDEVARTRSIDRFSTAMRVLARREPVNRRDARLVVSPARAAGNPRVLAPGQAPVVSAEVPPAQAPVAVIVKPAVSRARLAARRKAARAAARRRRHISTVLLLATAVTAGVAALGRAPWWSVSVPVVLTLAYLVLCRTQVRRESLHDFEVLSQPADEAAAETVVPRRAMRVEAQDSTPRQPAPVETQVVIARVDEHGVADFDDTEDTVGIPVAALLDVIAIPTEDGGSLWDPLPVTLPTYVTKAKAKRTVRTIDLGEPGTWTSGRTAEDTQIVAQAAAEQAEAETGAGTAARRAVSS
jgi:hypothetical protein